MALTLSIGGVYYTKTHKQGIVIETESTTTIKNESEVESTSTNIQTQPAKTEISLPIAKVNANIAILAKPKQSASIYDEKKISECVSDYQKNILTKVLIYPG